jgi:hypothetical protein
MDIPLPGGAVDGSEDYSPATTVVTFDQPLPLLRAPVPSSAPGDAPVLAFRDAASWRAAWEAAEASLFSQCEVKPIPACQPVISYLHVCVPFRQLNVCQFRMPESSN